MGKIFRISLTLIVVAVAGIAGYWIWSHYLYSPWTRDGRVRAEIITIAPDVSGWVNQLNVKDNQVVNKGDVLFTVDDTRYKATIAELNAKAESQKLAWELAKHKYKRRIGLTNDNLVSKETFDEAFINTELARTSYELAQAQLNTAKIDLARTQIHAPENGTLINLSLRNGNYVSKGNSVFSLVKQDSLYITGYFEETKIPLVHIGQNAEVSLMSGGHVLHGKVVSIGKAIANTNVTTNGQLLPQIGQTFNWVRLSQRIPVDIQLDNIPKDIELSVGMTVSIQLQTDQ
ncbi:efflux transporter periplasmic adaptor subunit [Shewanella sp. Pdp11]|uniref:efflux RND transporter periplasmic adaptor subunit n=1 Tax=Shewanella sp. Pdp11 TaxID=2059264 RepID=UPI000CA25B21|nr:HlyD family secretion protein [Shewanella sp. Pdp11]AUD58553.1 efflux transporter periplasmic adaptor subunit [Shewanella sp. Pdp11]